MFWSTHNWTNSHLQYKHFCSYYWINSAIFFWPNHLKAAGEKGPGWDWFNKGIHWCVWLILAHLLGASLQTHPDFGGNYKGKQMIYWNDTLRVYFSHSFAMPVFIIWLLHSYKVWKPEASGKEDQKLAGRAVFLTTSISILHRWRLPGLKGIDRFALPPWLTFTPGVFYFKNLLFI